MAPAGRTAFDVILEQSEESAGFPAQLPDPSYLKDDVKGGSVRELKR